MCGYGHLGMRSRQASGWGAEGRTLVPQVDQTVKKSWGGGGAARGWDGTRASRSIGGFEGTCKKTAISERRSGAWATSPMTEARARKAAIGIRRRFGKLSERWWIL